VTDLAGGAAAATGISEPDAGAMTVLLMGVDARPGAPIDVGVKSDVLIVLRLDPSAGTCRALSIPRDTRVELPGYGLSKINHALLVGGIPYQLMVVEGLLGIQLDHYALVDFAAFSEIVETFGGVSVEVPETLPDAEGAVLFEAGPQRMDGGQALAYVRYRHEPDGDIGRIGRQWAVLRALGEAASGRDLVRDVGTLLPAVEDHVRTDLTPEEMTALAQVLGGRCTAETVEPAVLAGTRVRLMDPILQQSVYYNLVEQAYVHEQVAALLDG
jgi:LCP family protein required for cell wall assembly